MNKSRYYELVDLLKKQGIHYEKRHGEYRQVEVIPNYILQLDTWSKSISCYHKENDRYLIFKHVGTDWGGFNCDNFWVEYFLAHMKKD